MRRIQTVAAALAFAGVLACNEREAKLDKPGVTETTGATQPAPEATPAPAPAPAPTSEAQTEERQTTTAAKDESKKAETAKTERKAKPAAKKKSAITAREPDKAKETATEESDEQDRGAVFIEERTVIIDSEPKAKSATEQQQRPAEPRSETMTPPAGTPQAPTTSPEPYVNHSTTLGDGKSGMYTDGQGTYGGRATWGTGGSR